MPQHLTYPGVYIQELDSGVHTITGVATSITAFIGQTRSGPVSEPTTVYSYAEFVRMFGGDWDQSWLPDVVGDFFANGGGVAIVIRAMTDSIADPLKSASQTFDLHPLLNAAGSVVISAKYPGDYGNSYSVHFSQGLNPKTGAADTAYLKLEVSIEKTILEKFESLELTNFMDVVNHQSQYVHLGPAGANPTLATLSADPVKLADGADGPPPDRAAFEQTLSSTTSSGPIEVLDQVDLFNLLVVPPLRPTAMAATEWAKLVSGKLIKVCEDRRVFLVMDAPSEWNSLPTAVSTFAPDFFTATSKNMGIVTPWITKPDPAMTGKIMQAPVSGAVAGIMARTDDRRGVWKAPAGMQAGVLGALGPARKFTEDENGQINSRGIVTIMSKPNAGTVVWGTRTTVGYDFSADADWKYIPVRRLFLFVEETLRRNTQWVVFEENNYPLWSQVKLDIRAFLDTLFRQGAFQGKTASEAYYVACGWETMTQADIDNGILNIEVGFAPVKPAEFVVISFRQKTNSPGAA